MGVYLGAHYFIQFVLSHLFYFLVFLLPHELEHYAVYPYVVYPYVTCPHVTCY